MGDKVGETVGLRLGEAVGFGVCTLTILVKVTLALVDVAVTAVAELSVTLLVVEVTVLEAVV